MDKAEFSSAKEKFWNEDIWVQGLRMLYSSQNQSCQGFLCCKLKIYLYYKNILHMFDGVLPKPIYRFGNDCRSPGRGDDFPLLFCFTWLHASEILALKVALWVTHLHSSCGYSRSSSWPRSVLLW